MAGEAARTHRQSMASAVSDAQNLREISALESRKKGMRKWSTDARIMAFPTQERTGSLFEDFNDEEPAAEEDGMVHVLPAGQKKQFPKLRSNVHMSFNHDNIYQSQDGDFFWFQLQHRRASRRDVEALDRLLSGMTGRNADLKPNEPPQEMLRLLPRMSTETEVERDLVLTSLRVFHNVLRCKVVGSTNSDTSVKEIRNPKGVKGGLNLTLNATKLQTRDLFVKNIVRQVDLGLQKQRATEKFRNNAKELRFMKAEIAQKGAQLMQARHEYLIGKQKDESLICAMYDNIASDLNNCRQFWDEWMRQDGPADESYQAVSAIFGDRAMRQAKKKQMSDPVERAKTIDLLAHAYADAQIRQGKNLTFNDKEFGEGHSAHTSHAARDVFTFRDEPERGMARLSLQELKERASNLYMKRRPISASRLEQRSNKVDSERADDSRAHSPAFSAIKRSPSATVSKTVSWDSVAEEKQTAALLKFQSESPRGSNFSASAIADRRGSKDTQEEQETCAVCTCTFAVRSDGSGSICCPKSHHLCGECTYVFVQFIFNVGAAVPVKVLCRRLLPLSILQSSPGHLPARPPLCLFTSPPVTVAQGVGPCASDPRDLIPTCPCV